MELKPGLLNMHSQKLRNHETLALYNNTYKELELAQRPEGYLDRGECATLQAAGTSDHAEHAQDMDKTGKQNPLLVHLETLHRQSNACRVWTEPKCIRARLNPFSQEVHY